LVLTGTAGLTKTGAGTLILSHSNAYSGTTRVMEGQLLAAHPRALASSPASVSAGATFVLGANVDASVKSLDLASGGRVDIGTGSLTVTGSMAAATVFAKLVEGRANGQWSGTSGIMSSAVAADIAAKRPRAVGWKANGGGSVTFSYAAPGDTNLDGIVDMTDVAGFLAAGKFNRGVAARWEEGDFNYDGVVDLLDAAEFLTRGLYDSGAYGPSAAAPTTAGVAIVPEPVVPAAGIACLMAIWASRRRRPANQK
jgi:autotransporter-associated beta strand protein